MYARKRKIKLNNNVVLETPLLVPSYSSKGFHSINEIIQLTNDLIDSAALVSCFDIHYQKISSIPSKPNLIFLDSGGYEASKEFETYKFGKSHFETLEWSESYHQGVIKNQFPGTQNFVLISYDHPGQRICLNDQIEKANNLFSTNNQFIREILVKPEQESPTINIENVISHMDRLSDFDILGFTEKELGSNTNERLMNLKLIRSSLDTFCPDTPIHIFGCLDPILTPLYYLLGADIFDGLSWLRLAFVDGLAIYQSNYSELVFDGKTPDNDALFQIWYSNYWYLSSLELEMKRYSSTKNFDCFKYNRQLLEDRFNFISQNR